MLQPEVDLNARQLDREARRSFGLAYMKSEGAWAIGGSAACMVLLSLLNATVAHNQHPLSNALHGSISLLAIIAAFIVRRPGFPPAAVPWVIVGIAIALSAILQIEIWFDPTTLGVAYLLLVMLGFGAFVHDARAFAVAAVAMFVGAAVVIPRAEPDGITAWIIACIGALAGSAAIMLVRLRGLHALAAADAAIRGLATRDPLTGVYNRRGIEERVNVLMDVARRQRATVFAAFIDIDGLKTVNDEHGHATGDDVVVAVAAALTATARAADAIGRWGGDEFLVFGIGDVHDDFRERLLEALQNSGIVSSVWPGTVTVGTSRADAVSCSLEQLVADADAHMYKLRRDLRN